ncbi:hypothetical protein BMI76_02580 [Streptococcus sp. 'caviae']|nr:hypothetical protein BMI76_02580 [Streptococcus sp. 'caviae']
MTAYNELWRTIGTERRRVKRHFQCKLTVHRNRHSKNEVPVFYLMLEGWDYHEKREQPEDVEALKKFLENKGRIEKKTGPIGVLSGLVFYYPLYLTKCAQITDIIVSYSSQKL